MYQVSNYILRFARAMLLGALIATIWVNLAPASYYDVIEARLVPPVLTDWVFTDWLFAEPPRITLISLVTEAGMALFVFLLGKELWEAHVLERGMLHGRRSGLPFLASAGAVVGAIAVWVVLSALTGTAEEASFAAGWALPVGGDAVIAWMFGHLLFGRSHPALSLLLLIAIGTDLAGLAVLGAIALTHVAADAPLRLLWLALPALAAGGVWGLFGRHARSPSEIRRETAQNLAPYIVAAGLSWLGVMLAGLPGVIGLLPVIPAIPHASRAFGLFAAAEELLHDPLNRLAHLAMIPLVGVLFIYGLTRGGVDLRAFAPTTIVVLAAFWFGRPAGFLAGSWIAQRLLGFRPPAGVAKGDMRRLALLMGIGFSVPLVAIETALPGGAMAEAARMGLAITLLAGPFALLVARRRPGG